MTPTVILAENERLRHQNGRSLVLGQWRNFTESAPQIKEGIAPSSGFR